MSVNEIRIYGADFSAILVQLDSIRKYFSEESYPIGLIINDGNTTRRLNNAADVDTFTSGFIEGCCFTNMMNEKKK